MKRLSLLVRLFTFLVFAHAALTVHGFLLPGMTATAYRRGDRLRAEVNDIRSTKNPVQFDYYSKKLPYYDFGYTPSGKQNSRFSSGNSLGAILSGERHQWSPYEFTMLQNQCYYLKQTTMSQKMVKRMIKLINRRYRVLMDVDGLPAANNGARILSGQCSTKFKKRHRVSSNYQRGYYIGVPTACVNAPLVNNHIQFTVQYHAVEESEREYFKEMDLSDGTKAFRQQKRPARKPKQGQNPSPISGDALYLVVGIELVPYSIDWTASSVNIENICTKVDSVRAAQSAAFPGFENHIPFNERGEDEDDEDGLDDHSPIKRGDENADETDAEEDYEDDEDDEDEKTEFEDENEEKNDEKPEEPKPTEKADPNERTLKPVATASPSGFQVQNFVSSKPVALDAKDKSGRKVMWTYDVNWVENPTVKWATRWDAFFAAHSRTRSRPAYTMWALGSLGIVVALLSLVIAVLLRSLRRDLLRSMPVFLSPEEELAAKEEESGWKVIRGDVFRPPPHVNALTALTSAGVQLFFASGCTLLFAVFGFAAPSTRGSFVSLAMVFFLLSAAVGGATCTWLLAVLGQEKRVPAVLTLVFGFSGAIIALFTAVNLILRMDGSSGALPFASMMAVYVLWLLVYCPLGLVGAVLGYAINRAPVKEKVTVIKRVIDYQKVMPFFRSPRVLWYSGAAPYFVVSLLLDMVFLGLWGGSSFRVFGFCGVASFIWMLSCALTSISVVYYNLSGENYHWHWLSFFAPSSGGLYVGLHIIRYFFTTVRATAFTAIVVYFSYMSLFAVLYVIVAGAIGFVSSHFFVRFIYSSAKKE